MSTAYEKTGRTRQKLRTRTLLVEAARALVAEGRAPTVEDAAVRADVSRTTAYRYFPDQRSLLAAAHPEVAATSLLADRDDDDVAGRLRQVVAAFTDLVADTEVQQRTMLRLSLAERAEDRGPLPLRQGRAVGWIGEALEPLRGSLTDDELHRLALAIRSCTGIEALVWLTDVGGLDRAQAAELMRWSAQALLSAAQQQAPPVSRARRGRARTAPRGAGSRG